MATRKEVLKAKVSEVGRQGSDPRVAFLATLLTCRGRAWRRDPDNADAFYDYSCLHGVGVYTQEFQHLATEGVIQTLPQEVKLNYEGDDRALESLSEEFAHVLFPHGRRLFLPFLQDILSRHEGEYALTELSKVGTEDTVHHVSEAIGSRHREAISNKLKRAGLFVVRGSSRRHTYYALYPALRPFILLEDERVKEVLAHIYIGQRVRRDGLLQRDCASYRDEVDSHVLRGLSRGVRWYGTKDRCLNPFTHQLTEPQALWRHI